MSESKEVILEAKHVTRRFRTTDGRTLLANNDVNLKFYKGETLGLVGESGCGKSTFMKFLVSLDIPSEGEILYRGKDITKLKGEQLRQNRQNIQMVFQDPTASFNPKMKIRDIICEPLLNFGRIKKSEKEENCRRLLELVELPAEFSDRYPHNMSGGQRQRVAIARALALEPEVIIMDEATSALDVSVQKTIIELITKLQREKNITIGFICHDIALIEQCAHQIASHVSGKCGGSTSGRTAFQRCCASIYESTDGVCLRYQHGFFQIDREPGRRSAKPAGAAGRLPVPGTMYQMYGDLQKRSSANGQPYTGSSGRLSSVYRKRTEIET